MSNISQIQVDNTTYDIKDTVARDEKINKSEISEPYDSTKTYNAGDIFEYNGELFQALNAAASPGVNSERITVCNVYKRVWTGSSENIIYSYIPFDTFAFTTDDNEKIWINTVAISNPTYTSSDEKWHIHYIRTTPNDIDGTVQWGIILAKNDLTGIANIDDANQLLKLEKIDDDYVVTYSNSTRTKSTVQGHARTSTLNVSQGISPIAYIRGYAVFKNDDNTETVMYTPCKLLSWEET